MAIPKKGSRCMTIDNITYRWILSPNDGYMVLYVELAEEPGQRLEAFFDYHDLYEPAESGAYRIVGQRRSVSPGVVHKVIHTALARGWQPSRRERQAFRVQDAEKLVPLPDENA